MIFDDLRAPVKKQPRLRGAQHRLHQLRRSVLMLLAVVLWCLIGAHGVADALPSGSTAVRLAVPDLAGSLYPLSHDFRSVRFGSSANARIYSAPRNASKTSCGSAFCLEIALASVFQADPFLLYRYDSQYPVGSPTFDGLQYEMLQPQVAAAAADSADAFATTWTFETNYRDGTLGDSVPTIDLLLRLRQLSQFRSSKDQLLLHVRAQLVTEHTATTAIESYSLYGNQRIIHHTRRIEANSLRISLAIKRDNQQRDVVVEDAYPLVILDEIGTQALVWWYTQPKCQTCSAQLFECSVDEIRTGWCDYSTTSAPFVRCLRDDHNMSNSWFADLLAEDVGSTLPILTPLRSCLQKMWSEQSNADDYRLSDWWNSTAALNCLAENECPFGPLANVLPESAADASKLIVIANSTAHRHDMVIDASVFTGVYKFTLDGDNSISITTSQVSESTSAEGIAAVINNALGDLLLAGDVIVAKSFDDGRWSVNVTISSLLLPDFKTSFITTAEVLSETPWFLNFSRLKVRDLDGSKLAGVASCKMCAQILSLCESDPNCQLLLPCLLAQFEAMTRKTGYYDAETGKNRLDLLEPLYACVGDSALSQWAPIAKAFTCAARFRCNLGAESTDDDIGRTFVKFRDGYQILMVDASMNDSLPVHGNSTDFNSSHSGSDLGFMDAGSNYTSGFRVNSSRGAPQVYITSMDPLHREVYTFDLTHAENLVKLIKAFVIQSAGNVSVRTALVGDNSSDYNLTLTYSNYLLRDLPKIVLDGVVRLISTKLPLAFFEFPDERSSPSLDTLIGQLQTLVNASSSATPGSNSSWILAPECVECSAQLFECSTGAVEQQTCQYSNAHSVFARCLSKRLPTDVFTDLVHVSAGSTGSVSIHSELAWCTEELDQAIPSTQSNAQDFGKEAKLRISRSLACFIESQCPFGPIDQVQLEHQVQLDTSTYIQVLRIHAPVFHLELEYRLGDAVISRFGLEETSSRASVLSGLQTVLSPAGIDVSIPTFQLEIGGAERTVEIQYANVVLPAFSVVVRNTSVPAPKTFVEQLLLRSAPRLRRAPRQISKVYRANNSSMNSTAPPPTVAPSTNAPALVNYSSQCADCVERYLKGTCRRSVFCQSIMLPCVAQSLNSMYSSTPTGIVDVRASIEECIALSSNSDQGFFYDWWAPLERFFVCFAREKCPANSANALASERSVLNVEPGSIEFVYASTSTDTPLERATAALEIVQMGPGSSFSLTSPYHLVGYRNELISVLQHMTQGQATTFSVDIEELSESSSDGSGIDAGASLRSDSGSDAGSAGVGAGSTSEGDDDTGSGNSSSGRHFRVRIKYSDEFLGFVPTISGTRIVVGSTRITQPTLSVRPVDTRVEPRQLNWGALRSMLQTESRHATTALPRSRCDRNFVASCQEIQACQQVISCLLMNLPRAGSEFRVYGTDFNLVQATYQCSWGPDATRPVAQLVACYEDGQWATGTEAATHSPTYLRTVPGRQLFKVTDASSALSLQTRVSAEIYARGEANGTVLVPFAGTIEELRRLLEDRTAASGVNVRLSSDSSQVSSREFEIKYERALGLLPSIQSASGDLLAVMPDSIGPLAVVFTSDNSKHQTSINFLLGAFERALSCDSVCEAYLKACTAGDSQTSLNCRERVLPCVSNALGNLGSPTSGSTTAMSIKDAVRQCSQLYTLQAFRPIQEFLLCYGSSSCTANNAYETGVPPSYLTFTPPSQLLHVELNGTAHTIFMRLPGRAEGISFMIAANESNLDSLEALIEDELLNGTTTIVGVLPMDSDGTSFSEYRIDYYRYLGALPSLAAGNASESWQIEIGNGDLALTSPKPWGSSTLPYDRLQSRLQAYLPRTYQSQSRPCSACFEMLMSCTACRQTLLPCLFEKLSTTVDYTAGEFQHVERGSGTEFAFAVRMCGVGLRFSQWAPVGRAFQCLMDNACLLSDAANGTDDPTSTFMIVENASQVVFALDKAVIDLQVVFQQEGAQYDPNAPGYTTIPLDRSDEYAALSELLNEYLRDAGGSATVAGVTNFNENFGLVLQEITINYTGFYGYTPAFGSPVFEDIHAVNEHPATFTLQSLDSNSPSWGALVDGLVAPSTTKVLAGECAVCAASLFKCAERQITDGSCSFSAAPNKFATCLRDFITRTEFASVLKGSVGTVSNVTSQFAVCLSNFVENEPSTGMEAEDDLWFTTIDALACWESRGCPFGPLSIAASDTAMVQLTSSSHEETFTIQGATTFSAVFVVQAINSRNLTTESFTEASTGSEIEMLLAAVLPPNVQVVIDKEGLDTGDGWTVHVSCSMLYLSAVTFALDAGDATVISSISGIWDVMLENAPLEASTMEFLF